MTRHEQRIRPRLAPSLVLLAILGLLGSSARAEVSRTIDQSFDLRSGDRVEVENLAGSIRVLGGSPQATLEATLHGESRELLDLLELEIEQRNGVVEVMAHYPVDRHDKYHYPAMSGTSRTSTRYQGEKVTLTGRTSGAVTLWIDFVLHLPDGVGCEVNNAAGDVMLQSVTGPIEIDTGSGDVRISAGRGKASIDTGSGHVDISSHRGDIEADTGSGNIRIRDAVGSVIADTGSGNILLDHVEGGVIDADTGSGEIELHSAHGEIRADTGSGSIVGHDLVTHGRLEVDTGSGGVRLDGDFRGATAIGIDTGSGSIELRGDFPGLTLEIDTSSGGITVDLPGFEVRTRERDHLEGRTGDGRVRLKVDTGSGSVTVKSR